MTANPPQQPAAAPDADDTSAAPDVEPSPAASPAESAAPGVDASPGAPAAAGPTGSPMGSAAPDGPEAVAGTGGAHAEGQDAAPAESATPGGPEAVAGTGDAHAEGQGAAVPGARGAVGGRGGTGRPAVDVAQLAAAMRSIERGENPAAPAPRGDAAEARRKRREAMAAETAKLQAAEAAEAAGTAAAPAAVDGTEPAPEPGTAAEAADTEPAADPAAPADVAATSAVEPAAPRRTAPKDAPPAGQKTAVDPGAVAAAKAVLEEGGAPGDLAEAAVRLLGERAADALREDPWLVLGVPGVRVEPADAFARALLGAQCGPGDERRSGALVGWLLERAAEKGHTALKSAALRSALTGYGVPDPESAVAAAVAEGQVLVFREHPATGDEEDEDEAAADVPLLLGLDRYALAEESLADGCVRLLRSFEADADPEAAAAWEKAAADAPSASAAELIRTAARSGLVAHTGGEAARAEPVALVAAARAAGLRAYAAAYTENGRRRLAEALGEDAAVTVEGLLTGTRGPGRAGDGSLALDLLAVLDAQQLGVEEATTLVEAVPDGARLVLSGDEHAMWSAGPGHAFADLLAAKCCPRVASRTPDPGPIGELVSLIGVGELAPVEAPDKEVVVVPVRDPREAVHRTVQLVADSVPRAIGVPAEQTQVITPGHGGAVGTRVLNAALKERLNPGPGRFAGFDPGDRVVHVPVPGRTLPGTVVGAEPEGLRLECEDGSVLVPREDVTATVRHGWAITGHQAAGMRWPAVVVVVPGDAGPLLNRSWVYSAFARGARHLSVVQGADQATLSAAVAGPSAPPRTTRLVSVLRELAADA